MIKTSFEHLRDANAQANLGDLAKIVNARTQVVAGTNYFIEVETSNNIHLWINVFRSLPISYDPIRVKYQITNASVVRGHDFTGLEIPESWEEEANF